MATAGGGGGAGSTGSTSGVKKPRLISSQTTTSHTSTSNTTPRSYDTSSSHQGFEFISLSFSILLALLYMSMRKF
jgi:hypothetical protein